MCTSGRLTAGVKKRARSNYVYRQDMWAGAIGEALPRPDFTVNGWTRRRLCPFLWSLCEEEGWFEGDYRKSVTTKWDHGLALSAAMTKNRHLFNWSHRNANESATRWLSYLMVGDDTVQSLQLCQMQAEHLLDWFHVTMQITVIDQMAKKRAIGFWASWWCTQKQLGELSEFPVARQASSRGTASHCDLDFEGGCWQILDENKPNCWS